jgi:hypothetical protein
MLSMLIFTSFFGSPSIIIDMLRSGFQISRIATFAMDVWLNLYMLVEAYSFLPAPERRAVRQQTTTDETDGRADDNPNQRSFK